MIQDINDIYQLIKSPAYAVKYDPCETMQKYDMFNTQQPLDHIHIEIFNTFMEIYKYKNMNSEYYEKIPTTNKHGQKIVKQFKELLLSKTLAAIVADTKKNEKVKQ